MLFLGLLLTLANQILFIFEFLGNRGIKILGYRPVLIESFLAGTSIPARRIVGSLLVECANQKNGANAK